MRKPWTVLASSFLVLGWASAAHAQGASFTPAALARIRAVAPRVVVTWDPGIASIDETAFRTGLAQSFERGVLRAGVAIDLSKEENLWCAVQLAVHSSGLVVFSARVELSRTLYEAGGFARDAITWKQDVLGAVGEERLDPWDLGRLCAEPFERDWRVANPGGR